MSNLFWKTESGERATLAGSEFKTEAQLEDLLYANLQPLGGLVVISRQTNTRNDRDNPDLIGVHTDGNMVMVERKRPSTANSLSSENRRGVCHEGCRARTNQYRTEHL